MGRESSSKSPRKTTRPAADGDLERRVKSVLGELQVISERVLSEIAERKVAEHELRRSQDTVTALLNASPDSALLISPDGAILAANGTAVRRLRRYAPPGCKDLVGLCVYDLFPAELTERRRKRNEAVIRSGKPVRYEDERNGRWFDNSIQPVKGDRGKIVGLAIFSREITERIKAERAIRQSKETIRALLNAPTDAALLVDASGTILAANDTAARRLATHARMSYAGDPDLLHGLNVYELLPRDLAAARRARNEEVVASGEPARYEDERNGHWFDNSIYPILDVNGRTGALAIFSRDITELKRAQEKFRHLAFHDSLTGLPNRAALKARMDVALAEAERSEHEVTVMCLDLNGFKQVNDSLGHEAGDRLLELLARRLGQVIRGDDTAARLGGDEFVLVFPGTGVRTAQRVVDRVLRALHVPYEVTDIALQMSVSVGIAVFPHDGLDTQSLLRHADAAMYVAKSVGGGASFSTASQQAIHSEANSRRDPARQAGQRVVAIRTA
jgi:diguanylate cyclase (GGDEF)-like protein/PAS domain S-box-containing protein